MQMFLPTECRSYPNNDKRRNERVDMEGGIIYGENGNNN